jgi:hypothetical protein
MKNNAASEPHEIKTLVDVAKYLNCRVSTIRGLLKGGELPALRLGGSGDLAVPARGY